MWFKYPYTNYSELNLDWFLEQFKKLKDEWDTTSGEWDQMQLDFQTLEGTVQTFTTFVTHYFDNLDVQQEINNKLDQMAQDGTLADLLAPLVDDKLPDVVDDKLGAVVTDQLPGVVTDQLPDVVEDQIGAAVAPEVPAAVTAWLDDNVNPVGSAVTIDSSLSVEGSAGDALSTGNLIRVSKKVFEKYVTSDVLDGQTWEVGAMQHMNNWSGMTTNTVNTRYHMQLTLTKDLYDVHMEVASGYKYQYAFFDSSNVSHVSVNTWQTGSIDLHDDNGFHTLRLMIAKSDDSVMSLADTVMQITDNAPKEHTKLKVMSYNVGKYTHGINTAVTEDDQTNIVNHMRSFLADQKPDLIGLQENRATLYDETSFDSIYDPIYPGYYAETNLTALVSRYDLKNTGSGTFTGDRTYVYGEIEINGINIFLISVHFALTAEDRATDWSELLAILNTKQYFICFGDFNAGNHGDYETEYANAFNAGYHGASGGYLGYLPTLPSSKYYDNIFTSNNILVTNSYVPDVFSALDSDHIPIIAELEIIYKPHD